MKTSLATFFISLSIPFAAIAEDIPVDSDIASVSLFRDGAMVTRQAELAVPSGKSTLIFENLPTQLDPSALQANFLNSPNGLIRNAKVTKNEDPEENEELQTLESQIEAAEKAKSDQKRIASDAASEIEFVQDMAKGFADEFGKISESGTRLTLSDAQELQELLQATKRQAYAKIEAANKEIEDIEEQIEALEKQYAEAERKVYQLISIAAVEIEMDQSATIQVELSYLAQQAYWMPRYELRAKPSQESLNFGYFASVAQNTGEDWDDITLSLHTNRANRMGNVPELYAMKLSQRPDYGIRHLDAMARAELSAAPPEERLQYSTRGEAAGATSNLAVDKFGQAQEVAVSSSTVSFQATVPGKITVASSQDEASYQILEASLETEYWSEVVPKVQLDTYLKGKLKNTLDLPILQGTALAFVDGKLSSKVALEKTLPNEELELSLGTDQNVVVKRKEGSQEDKTGGFIDKTKRLTREYVNTVTNYHGVAHKVIIVDQFPIAQDAKIEIKRLSPKEDEAAFEDPNDGIFKWETEIDSEQSKTFTTSFQVTYPKDWNLYPDL